MTMKADENLGLDSGVMAGQDNAERGSEVYAPADMPFEAPAKEFVPGPLYKSVEERLPQLEPEAESENASELLGDLGFSEKVGRRDLLKVFSAGSLLASTACIRRPVEKAIPYVQQPVDQYPGEAVYYATTCGDCSVGCGLLVRTREGRPIKIEGNPRHPMSQGATCTLGQSGLQALYHPERLKSPQKRDGSAWKDVSFDDVYGEIAKRIENPAKVAILAPGATGNRHGFFREFLTKIGSSESNLYTYEPNSLYAYIAAAHKIAYGHEVLPRVDFAGVNLVVGIGSDFLDIGTSPVFLAKGFAQTRDFGATGSFSKLVQFEASLTLTGAKADDRHVIRPGSELAVAFGLLRALAAKPGAGASDAAKGRAAALLSIQSNFVANVELSTGLKAEVFENVAAELVKGEALIFAGGSASFDATGTQLQLVAILLNELIGAYGKRLILDKGWVTSPVRSNDLERFAKDVEGIETLIVIDSNPAFNLPASWGFKDKVSKIKTVLSIQSFPTETDEFAHYRLPNHHYLESWGDEQPVAGYWSTRQPVVRAISGSRQAEDMLLWIAANLNKPMGYSEYQDFLKKKWEPLAKDMGANIPFDVFEKAVLRRGVIGKLEAQTLTAIADLTPSFKSEDAPAAEGMVLLAPLDPRLHDGRGAVRPILQEIGDGLTTVTWGTWVAMNPATCMKMGFKRNTLVKVESDAGSFTAAVYPLPGLHPDAVVVPRGNGRDSKVSEISAGFGVDPLVAIPAAVDVATGVPATSVVMGVKVSATGDTFYLAAMQKHNDIANREDVVKKVHVDEARSKHSQRRDLDTVPDLYPKLAEGDYRWGLSVDLSKCTGCGACMVACAQENNVPQVGPAQIRKGREMHWIRLDRYFAGPVANPKVTFQPVMCQQCNHAPCEAVCPVFATTHDAEGINSMTYNRCVGTRYCANACPYKVRRFNWFTFTFDLGKKEHQRSIRAMNPDVTVRVRGIMEKCNFCVQRLREAKHADKLAGTRVNAASVKVACQQVCPSDALTFGDLKDPRSRINASRTDNRAYLMLGGEPEHGHFGIKTLPNVSYLAQLTHSKEGAEEATENPAHG